VRPLYVTDLGEVRDMAVVEHERGELEAVLGAGRIGGRGDVPDFDFSAQTDGKMVARRGEGESGQGSAEGEVVHGYAPVHIGQDGMAILVDGEEEVPARSKTDAGDVFAMRERECA